MEIAEAEPKGSTVLLTLYIEIAFIPLHLQSYSIQVDMKLAGKKMAQEVL